MNEIESYKDLPQESSFRCVSEPGTSIHRDPRTSKRFPSHNSSHKYHIQCLKVSEFAFHIIDLNFSPLDLKIPKLYSLIFWIFDIGIIIKSVFRINN